MIRVLIVDNTHLGCSVTSYVLQNEKDIKVVGYAIDVDEALVQVQAGDTDIVLVSAAMADNAALRLTQSLIRLGLPSKVLVTGLPEFPEVILRFIEAGAAGYVLKNASVEELLKNIRLVHQNAAIVSPEIAGALMMRVAQLAGVHLNTAQPLTSQFTTLTSREREVLSLMHRGFSNLEIARHLCIEVGTVKNHVHNILRKLEVSTRREAAAQLRVLETTGLVTPA